MMRATLILVGVGSLVAMELATPPRVAKAVNHPLAQSIVGVVDSRDTLTKGDRLEIPYFQSELPARQISFVERMSPMDPTPNTSKNTRNVVSANRHDAKTKKVALVRPKPRPKNPDSKRRPKTTDSKAVTSTVRSKIPMEVRPCRPNALDSFLKALNLSSGCET